MNPTKLRKWMQKYGVLGVLFVGGILGLHHLWTKRRGFVITIALVVCAIGGWSWWHDNVPNQYLPPTEIIQMLDPAPTNLSLKDLPGDFESYKVDPYLQAASGLQRKGKEKAIQELQELAKEEDLMSYRVFILCRMLFTKKSGAEFRRPMLGAPCFLLNTPSFSNADIDSADWKREPIEIVDGVPFLVTRGYELAGYPEPASDYLEYCIQKCDWNPVMFEPKSFEEKEQALEKLLAYPKLKVEPEFEERLHQFLTNQIE